MARVLIVYYIIPYRIQRRWQMTFAEGSKSVQGIEVVIKKRHR